jgi:hypothetical protein
MSYLEGRMLIVGKDEVVWEASPKAQVVVGLLHLAMLALAIWILMQGQQMIDACVQSGGTWNNEKALCQDQRMN